MTTEYLITETTVNQTTIEQYIVVFDSFGGNEIDSMYVDKGSTVDLPIPTKEGNIFLGWFMGEDINDAQFTVSSIVTKDITLYAKWDIVTYNITYNLDDGTNGTNPDTYTVETPTITLANPTKEGYTFNGWFDNLEYTGNPITEIALGTTTDITLYAKWTINQYTITFDTDGGPDVDSITQDYKTLVTAPADPTREGYTFSGWYSDASLTQPYVFDTMPAEDITLYAKWTINP